MTLNKSKHQNSKLSSRRLEPASDK